MLQPTNDRAITRLAGEDAGPGEPDLQPQTEASAGARIASWLAFGAEGRVSDADVTIAGSEVIERYVRHVLESCDEPSNAASAAVLAAPGPTETYRRVAIDEGLRPLRPLGSR